LPAFFCLAFCLRRHPEQGAAVFSFGPVEGQGFIPAKKHKNNWREAPSSLP
jgi:hypothetical protein